MHAVAVPNVGAARPAPRLLPSVADVLFCALAVGVPLGLGARLMREDGDLGRHLRVGEVLLERRAFFYVDEFSFTMAGQPFVPYEWLSEVLFALANRVAGLPGVVVLTGLAVAATYGLVVLLLRRHGVDPLLALLVGTASALVGSIHWLARPHIFTPLGAVLALHLLEPGTGQPRRAWLFVPLFAVWANLHGGFLYGLLLISLYLAGSLLEGAWTRSWFYARALAAALVGSAVNPSGPWLFAHVSGYLGKGFLLDQTIEYRSPDFHLLQAQVFLLALLAVVALLATSGRRIRLTWLGVILANMAFALYAARNIPLFGVVALALAALDAAGRWTRLAWLARPRASVALGEQASGRGPWSLLAAGLTVTLAVAQTRWGGPPVLPTDFDANRFPVAAVERARAAGLEGRIYNSFGWGGYLLYAWPEQRVFIDGQTDFYGEALSREYLAISRLDPGWRDALRQRDVSLVLVERVAPLAHELAREPGWRVWYCDATAALLQRAPGQATRCAGGEPLEALPPVGTR